MALFFGAQLSLDYVALFRDLALMIVLPTIVGVIVNHVTKGNLRTRIHPFTAPSSKIAFVLVVMINVAAIAPYVNESREKVLSLVPVTVAVVMLCYLLGFIVTYFYRKQEYVYTIPYLTGMRNISLGIVVGLQYFGALAAVPVVLAILIQQPMATLNHWLLKTFFHIKLR
jgi:predicted Na+-dependent transporter